MKHACLTYARDNVRQRITVTITGPAPVDDPMRVVDRQVADGT